MLAPEIVKKSTQKARLLSTDDDTRSAVWLLTNGTLDRDSETVAPDGGEFGDYARNAVIAFNHDTESFPIGMMHPLDPNYRGEPEIWLDEVDGKPALLGRVYFSRVNPVGVQAYEQVKEGSLKGGSISFLPIGPVSRNQYGGNHYDHWKLLEFSICPIGSNPDALKMSIKAMKAAKDKQMANKVASVEKRGSLYYVRLKAMDLDAFVQAVLHALPFAVGAGQLGASIINIINGLRKMGKSPKEVANEIKDDIKGAKAMKLKRKLWTRGKSALLLKSEGGVDSETAEYLKQRGLDDVQIVDQPPAKAEPGTPEWEEEEEMEPEHQAAMKADDYATAVTTALDPATSDEKIDEAMDDEGVPEEMKAAVKGIVRRSIQKDGGDVMAGKVPHDTDSVPTSADDLQKTADGIAMRAKELMNKGADEEGAVEAAMKEADVPEEVAKKVRKRALKAVRKGKYGSYAGPWVVVNSRGQEWGDYGNRSDAMRGLQEANRDAPGEGWKVDDNEEAKALKRHPKALEKQRADDETFDAASGGFIEPLTEPEAKVKDALSDCVSNKISLMAKEGKDPTDPQTQAIAFSHCGEKAAATGVTKRLVKKLFPYVMKAIQKSQVTKGKYPGYGPWVVVNNRGQLWGDYGNRSDAQRGLAEAQREDPKNTYRVDDNEDAEKSLTKAAADADQQTSTALADLQKSITKRPALSKANAKTIRKAADEILSASLKANLKEMADDAAEDKTAHLSKSFRKAIARKKLKRKEVAALEAAAKELDSKVEEKNGGAGIAEPDAAERLSKLARKLRKIAAKRGKHKGADDGQQTSLAAADLQKRKAAEEEEKRRKAEASSDPDAEDHAMAEKIRALTEKAQDAMAKVNKTNETLYRATGMRN